jgi:transposase-like protein
MHTRGGQTMPSNNSKYSEEMRERTARHIIESGKSATSVAEEMGIDTNTVCRWVRDYRRKNHLPSYTDSKGIKQSTSKADKEANKQLKAKDKRIKELEEEVEILKKSLHIFMQPL